MSRLPRLALCVALVVGGLALPACERSQTGADPAAAPTTAPAVDVVLTTPLDAARSVLNCLRAQRAARARRDAAALEHYGKLLRSMAAREVILERYAAATRRPPEDADQVLDTFLQGWAPIIGYYAEGLKLEQARVLDRMTPAGQADVHVPALGAEGDAVIRLECFRDADGKWRVARIDFVPTRATSQPTAP